MPSKDFTEYKFFLWYSDFIPVHLFSFLPSEDEALIAKSHCKWSQCASKFHRGIQSKKLNCLICLVNFYGYIFSVLISDCENISKVYI